MRESSAGAVRVHRLDKVFQVADDVVMLYQFNSLFQKMRCRIDVNKGFRSE